MRLDTTVVFMVMGALLGAVALGDSLIASAVAKTQAKADTRVSEILKTCFSCHGRNAVNQISSRPTLAGQKSAYIASQLRAFQRTAAQRKKGTVLDSAKDPVGRSNPAMDHVITGLDADLIDQIAAAISMRPCNEKRVVRSIPPLGPVGQKCIACHGINGIGKQPTIPNLAGQPRAYLRRQLLLLRENAWNAKPLAGGVWRRHPLMENQATRLSIADLDSLASYFSALDCRGFPPGKSPLN